MAVADDPAILAVESALRDADPDGTRVARILRETYDQIYDGGRTRRYSWEQLGKTEKTHFGSLIEINLFKEFRFEDGAILDYRIAGTEVDCKWSAMIGGQDGDWMLPREALGQICLLLTGNDALSMWSGGLIRVTPDLLRASRNQDKKMSLSMMGKASVRWIWRHHSLPENVLLTSDRATVESIMALPTGQSRINEFFRRITNRVIGRAVVETLAQQKDPMKRLRGAGGAREYLKPEGIVIFGGNYLAHRRLAFRLGLAPMGDSDSMSARLIAAESTEVGAAKIGDSWYRLCGDGEEPTLPAPDLPTQD